MELLPHLLEHAFEDTIYLVPFLLATYILLELLEHKAGNKAAVLVRKAGIAGPFVGSLLGRCSSVRILRCRFCTLC